jgi:hypothetical protein
MIAELGIALLLTAAGYSALALLSGLGNGARIWLSFPVGASIYLMVALSSLVMFGSLAPADALLWTGIIGVAAGTVALASRAWDGGTLAWLGAALALAALTVLVARQVHLTRLTPD